MDSQPGPSEPGPSSKPGPSGHSTDSITVESTTAASLLNKLKCPPQSELARKRKISTNPHPTGIKRCEGS